MRSCGRAMAIATALLIGVITAPGAVPASAAGSAAGAAPSPTPVQSPVLPAAAPAPTSTAASPDAPDPSPPLGGIGPDGHPVGGPRLLGRGVVVPAGAPALPVGITAAAFVLVDLDGGTVLAAKDAHGRYQPASILKTLTSLVLLPRLPGATVVPVSQAAADTEGSAVGLVPGGTYSADVLFQAMLLMSGNDAVAALCDAAGGPAAVVAAMNSTALSLGAYDTVVQTPTGLDGWTQLTSAYDMALVLRAALADSRFADYDRTLRAFLPAQNLPTKAYGTVEMDNQSEDFLTGYPGALVAKTGFTDAARHTFLAAAQRGGRRLGVVLLRAERVPTDQWQQAAALLDWGYALPAGEAPIGRLAAAVPAAAASTASNRSAAGAAAKPGGTTHTSATAGTSTGPAGEAAARTAQPSVGELLGWGLTAAVALVLLVAWQARAARRAVG